MTDFLPHSNNAHSIEIWNFCCLISVRKNLKSISFLRLTCFRREFGMEGMERFVPVSLLERMKRKELRRLIGHFLKLNQQMTGSSKMLTQLQVSENRALCVTCIFWCSIFLLKKWMISRRWFVLGCIIIKFKAHRAKGLKSVWKKRTLTCKEWRKKSFLMNVIGFESSS